MSDSPVIKVVRRLFGVAIGVISALLAFPLFMSRIDNLEEWQFIRVLDCIVGFGFAATVLLLYPSKRSVLLTFGEATAALVLVSGFLLLWHEIQIAIRWGGHRTPEVELAEKRVEWVHLGLQNYAGDCGNYPPEQDGLAALLKNPGVAGWSGPYTDATVLIDPWGNALEYHVRDDHVEVWSNGPDGKTRLPRARGLP
jgi:hypothetical protein